MSQEARNAWTKNPWQNGIHEAVERLMQQVNHPPFKAYPHFDARDRMALAYLIGYVQRCVEQDPNPTTYKNEATP